MAWITINRTLENKRKWLKLDRKKEADGNKREQERKKERIVNDENNGYLLYVDALDAMAGVRVGKYG